MEFINKVELLGTIGRIQTRVVGGKNVANIQMVTTDVFNGKSGLPVVENTWHKVTAWEGPGVCDFSQLQKGNPVHVFGKLRIRKYTDQSGVERIGYEILASEVTVPETDDLP